jgi:hypothetical protein
VCASYPEGRERRYHFFTSFRELVETLSQWHSQGRPDIRLTWGKTPDELIDHVERELEQAGIPYTVPSGKRAVVACEEISLRPGPATGVSRPWRAWVIAPRYQGAFLALSFLLTVLACLLVIVWVVAYDMMRPPGAVYPGLIPGLTLVGLGAIIFQILRYARRLRARHALRALEEDPRAPLLLLRSFGDDALELPGYGPRNSLSFLTFGGQTDILTFEEMIYHLVSRCGPVIAVGRPGERTPPLGASRMWVRNDGNEEQWKQVVSALIEEAQYSVMILGDPGRGLAWEAGQLFALQDPRKVVLVMPPVDEAEASRRWGQYRDLSGGRLPPYAGGEIVAAFAPDGGCRIVRVEKSGWFRKGYTRSPRAYNSAIKAYKK